MMNTRDTRLGVNPILTSLFLGVGQGTLTAQMLFPALPMALRGMTLPKMGTERLRKYDLLRAPGADARRIDIHYAGVTYTVKQKTVDIPVPRENIDEASNMSGMFSVPANLDMSKSAVLTAGAVLDLDYEIEVAQAATSAGFYAAGNVLPLAGGTKWSSSTGTPVTDILQARKLIRQNTGKNPNMLHFSAVAWDSIQTNPQVINYLSRNNLQLIDIPVAQRLFQVEKIVVGDAIWENATGTKIDVWGNNAILAFVPVIGDTAMDLGQPAFGTTNILKGSPSVETPWYDPKPRSWIFGATFERDLQVGYAGAGFLFQNPY